MGMSAALDMPSGQPGGLPVQTSGGDILLPAVSNSGNDGGSRGKVCQRSQRIQRIYLRIPLILNLRHVGA